MGRVLALKDYRPKRVLKERRVVTPQEIIDEYYRLQRERNVKVVGEEKGFITKVEGLPVLPNTFKTGDEERAAAVRAQEEETLRQMALYRRRPTKFIRRELGIPTRPFREDLPKQGWSESTFNRLPLWTKQVDILKALVDHRKVTVKSGHGSGKTYVAATAAIYLAYAHGALGITTAPTGRQVKRLLWGEISKIWNYANQWQRSNNRAGLGGRLLQTSLELGDKWFVEGFSTDSKEANIPGFHAESIFVIVDEAGGVDPKVYELFETVLNSENVFVLLIGNPIDPNTEFKKSFDTGSGYYPITISCFDTPNVKHRKKIYPALCARDWPDRMKKKYGRRSSFYESRVLGNFPLDNVDGLIPWDKIISAKDRALSREVEVIAIGADIARLGGDRIVVGKRWSNGRYREVINESKRRLTETSGKLVVEYEKANRFNKKVFTLTTEERTDNKTEEEVMTPVINVDDIGVGGGVTDILLEQDLPANGVNVSESPDKGTSADEQGIVKFKNKRAQYYWNLREAFMSGRVDIDASDEELEQELLAVEIKYTGKGEIQVVEKDVIKKKLNGRSPDKVEAMMLAFAESDYLDAASMLLW